MKRIHLLAATAVLSLVAGGAQASTITSISSTLPADVFTPPTSDTGGTVVATGSVGGQYASPFGDDTSPYIAVQSGSATYNLAGNTLSLVFGSLDTYNTISFLNSAGQAFDTFVPGTGAGEGLVGGTYFLTIRADADFSAVQFSSTSAALEFSNVSVSSVPLPASAPMFGAALLALGGLGYSMKRKKAAAAV